jgi:hypothetical protein
MHVMIYIFRAEVQVMQHLLYEVLELCCSSLVLYLPAGAAQRLAAPAGKPQGRPRGHGPVTGQRPSTFDLPRPRRLLSDAAGRSGGVGRPRPRLAES